MARRRAKLNKPGKRPDRPRRRSDNNKRRLLPNPDPAHIAELQQNVRYQGSPKHKKHPHLHNLAPFRGSQGDATLCDRDATISPKDQGKIPGMIQRGLAAGLVGKNDVIWAVADDGWIYEGRITNAETKEYHGYPVLRSEAIAKCVYDRFAEWANRNGDMPAQQAAQNCSKLYGFR